MKYAASQRTRAHLFAVLSTLARRWLRHPVSTTVLIRLAAWVTALVSLAALFFCATSAHAVAPSSPVFIGAAITAGSVVSVVLSVVIFDPWLGGICLAPQYARACLPGIAQTPLASWFPDNTARPSRIFLETLDRSVRRQGWASSVNILSGQCPWLLAALLLHVLDPVVMATASADALDASTPRASRHPARPCRL